MPPPDKDLPVLDDVDEASRLKKHRRRMRSMWVFFGIFSLPVLIGLFLVIRSQRTIAAEQAWAKAELEKAEPSPWAYGVRGAGLLSAGEPAEALPLLEKAARIEAQSGPKAGVKALLMLIEAQLDCRKKAVAGVDDAQIRGRLKELEARAVTLAQGPQAAAWHAAGKLYSHLGAKEDALRCLKKAHEMQPDDWVTAENGQRYKYRGIASIYEKDYAGATME